MFPPYSLSLTRLSACAATPVCKDKQWAAGLLGYTQVSWDNKSGKETQPSSSKKYWDQLTDQERAVAMLLGYTGVNWDKEAKKHQPVSAKKYWAELISCGENLAIAVTQPATNMNYICMFVCLPDALCDLIAPVHLSMCAQVQSNCRQVVSANRRLQKCWGTLNPRGTLVKKSNPLRQRSTGSNSLLPRGWRLCFWATTKRLGTRGAKNTVLPQPRSTGPS